MIYYISIVIILYIVYIVFAYQVYIQSCCIVSSSNLSECQMKRVISNINNPINPENKIESKDKCILINPTLIFYLLFYEKSKLKIL